jgi:hypothetical protein
VDSQGAALEKIAGLIRKGSIDVDILKAAKKLKRGCIDRDDWCEIQTIYNAVKYGDSRVDWLREGVQYVADPHPFDTFHSAHSIVEFCREGAGAFDCDDGTILIGSLCAAIGFKAGARAWGKGVSGDYQHVYPVVLVPKGGPWPRGYYGTGLDTTVPRFDVGDEPQGGHILTSWLRGD